MHVDLIIRADDPAAAANKLRALGFDLDPPNRPNPDRWSRTITGTMSILPANGEATGLALAVPSLERLRQVLGFENKKLGRDLQLDIGGASMTFTQEGGPVLRPHGDRMYIFHVETAIQSARKELAAAFRKHGIEGALLIGPETLLGMNANEVRYKPCFAMVIDGAGDEALREVRSLLGRHAVPGVELSVLAPADIDDAVLARAERTGWDVKP